MDASSIFRIPLSRIQALLGYAAEATRHAEVCLSYSGALEPFYVGYAYEALARAASVAGLWQKAAEYCSLARAQARLVLNAEHRALLVKDVEGLNA